MIMKERQLGPAGLLLRGILDSPRAEADSAGASATDSADLRHGGGDSAALIALLQTRPARTVAAKVAAAGGVDSEAALLLRELTARHLGADAQRWCGLHDVLVGHRGTLPALLELLAPAKDGALAGDPDPAQPREAGDALRPPAPRSVYTTLGLLLEHAEPQHAAGALAALPRRVAAELLEGGTPPAPALVGAVLDHGDSRVRAALAGHPRLDARVLARLLAVGDSRVAAAVYRNPRATQSLRRVVAHRLDAVPLDDALRADLTAPRGEAPSTWISPLLGSGDPELAALALRAGVRQVAQQYALLRVWERTGPHAVRALLDDAAVAGRLSRSVVATVTEALAEDAAAVQPSAGFDPSTADGHRDDRARTAVARLRARCEPYEDPARLPELLAEARGTSTLRDLLSEPYAHDLDALAAAHARSPFMPKACEELARHEAASDAQRGAFRLSVLNEPWRAGGRRSGNSTPPGERLAREPLDDSAARWAAGMAGAGLLDPAELVRTARPAAHACAALALLAERDLLTDASVAELRALAETHLGDHPETWAALDAGLPEHGGTLAQLLARAGKAAPAAAPAGAKVPGARARPRQHARDAGRGSGDVPSQPSTDPAAPSADPAAPSADPAAPSADPAAPSADPAAPSADPAAPSTDPAAPSAGPPAPSAEPSAPSSEPSAPSTDPAAPSAEPPAPSAVPRRRPPHQRDQGLGLAALDVLHSLAPPGAPLPDDPDVLRALSEYGWDETPGLATPHWFVASCAAHGVPPSEDGYIREAPSLADVRARPVQLQGSGMRVTELAYAQGVLPADELLTLLPARLLLLLPHDWRRLAFARAWRAALARRLRTCLGTDPDAWLRLAAAASAFALTEPAATADGPTWAELLDHARSAQDTAPTRDRTGPYAGAAAWPADRSRTAAVTTAAGAPSPGSRPYPATPAPRTPDEAIKLLERGDHLWAWPEGTLLCLADPETVDAVLPRLGADGPWLLAAYLLRHDTTPRHVLDRLLADGDPDALRVLAAQSRRLDDSSVERLVDLDDHDVDLALLGHTYHPHTVRRIVTRSQPVPGSARPSLGARVLAQWRTSGAARPAGGLTWLCSSEPDLIEELLVREGTRMALAHQLLGCLRMVELGGAGRLALVAGRGLLGRTATTVCAKALAADDPAKVVRARLDRELAPAKLLVKLRRACRSHHTREVMEALPPGTAVDWEALEAAHEQDPIPFWQDVVRGEDVPEEVRMRHAALLPEPDHEGLPEGARLTRERARYGLGRLSRSAPTTQLDGLLATGALTGSDLLHVATPAARMLAYLNAAARRTDAPPGAGAARTELAALVRSRLGTDPAAWARVAERLTGGDPQWEHDSTVAALLNE